MASHSKNILQIAASFWVLTCIYVSHSFGFLLGFFVRFLEDVNIGEKEITCFNHDSTCFHNSDVDDNDHEFGFTFGSKKESCFMGNLQNPTLCNYQFMNAKDLRGFIEDPKSLSFIVHQLYDNSIDSPTNTLAKDLCDLVANDHDLHCVELNRLNCQQYRYINNACEIPHDDDIEVSNIPDISRHECVNFETELHNPNKEANDGDSNHAFETSHGDIEVCVIEYESKDLHNRYEEFETQLDNLNEGDLNETSHGEVEICTALDNRSIEFEPNLNSLIDDAHEGYSNHGQSYNGTILDEPKDLDGEYIEFEPKLYSLNHDASGDDAKMAEKSWEEEYDDEVECENLREHEDLIQRLKSELRNVRIRGLPTISEELESPKIDSDMEPMKINDKWDHKDRMDEIQKFYKSYAERMRKLDVVNDQTLHAIEFLGIKNQVGRKRLVLPTMKLFSTNFILSRLQTRKDVDNPTLKFMSKLQRDLEMVYVGQLCLSWEILLWQYQKSVELQEYDHYGFRHYSQVACEFQQLQVPLQRFVENEKFQGPRVQNYAKRRSVLRRFLHIPAIKDDFTMDKKRREDSYSTAMLTEVIQESMHVFWEFLHADKANVTILKGFLGNRTKLENPKDVELLLDVQNKLQKVCIIYLNDFCKVLISKVISNKLFL